MDGHGSTTGLIPVGTLAQYLGVSKARLYQLARDQVVPSISVGRSVRFDPERIKRWLESGGSAYPGRWRKDESR